MPERWEREVRRIRSAEPSDGLWQRAEAGPARADIPQGPGRRSRVVALVVSSAVVIAAGFGLWSAFAHTRTLGSIGASPTASATETAPAVRYFVALPDTASARTGSDDTELIATVAVTTNLPDGTRALIRWTYRGGTQDGAGGVAAGPTVKDGDIDFEVPWGACDFGKGFSFRVEFRPFYEDYTEPFYPQGTPWPPTQSDRVLQVLGDHFQELTGEQVTTVGSSRGPIRQIAVSREYALPEPPSGFVPPPCPSPTSP